MRLGNLSISFDNSTSPFSLDPHQTSIAHSGNIHSFHIDFNSLFTNSSISSYLAVAIWLKYSKSTSQLSLSHILDKLIFSLLTLTSFEDKVEYSFLSFSAISIETLVPRAISLVTLSQPNGTTAPCIKTHSSYTETHVVAAHISTNITQSSFCLLVKTHSGEVIILGYISTISIHTSIIAFFILFKTLLFIVNI